MTEYLDKGKCFMQETFLWDQLLVEFVLNMLNSFQVTPPRKYEREPMRTRTFCADSPFFTIKTFSRKGNVVGRKK